jgi:hypothetical protein
MIVAQCTISGLCSDVLYTCDSSDKVLRIDTAKIFVPKEGEVGYFGNSKI